VLHTFLHRACATLVGRVTRTSRAVLRSYLLEDRLRLDFDLWFKDMTDHYFGVGYDAGKDTELGDSPAS
jgi:hypothetical protein